MSTARRPAARKKVTPKRRPQRSRARKASMMDHAIAALPFDEATLRKIATWSILGCVGAVALLIASVTGALGALPVEEVRRGPARSMGGTAPAGWLESTPRPP